MAKPGELKWNSRGDIRTDREVSTTSRSGGFFDADAILDDVDYVIGQSAIRNRFRIEEPPAPRWYDLTLHLVFARLLPRSALDLDPDRQWLTRYHLDAIEKRF